MDPFGKNEVQVASGGKRLGAYVIDYVFLGLVSVILVLAVFLPSIIELTTDLVNEVISEQEYMERYTAIIYGEKMLLVQLAMAAIYFFYFVVAAYTLKGASLGKKILGIRITDEAGSDAGFGKLFVREMVGKYLLNTVTCGLFSFISLFMILGQGKRGIHDIIAKTIVIESKPRYYL